MSMSLTETKLPRVFMANVDPRWEEDGGPQFLDHCPKTGVYLRSSNLAVAGFPTSLHPRDLAVFPANFPTKPRHFLPHAEDLRTRITMVMQGTCEVSPADHARTHRDQLARSLAERRCGGGGGVGGSGGGEVVSVGGGRYDAEVHAARRLGKDAGRLSSAGPMEYRADNGSTPSKKLKFGIEAILAIGSKHDKNSEKTKCSDDVQRYLGPWEGETHAGMGGCSREVYGLAPGKAGVGNRLTPGAVTSSNIGSSRPTWGNAPSSRPLGTGRWEGPSGGELVGRMRWTTRELCQEFHEHCPSGHSPYPWARSSDPVTQHCYPLQPTLPPSHPTLPRSYPHPPSVSSPRSDIGGGLDANSAGIGCGGGGGVGVGLGGGGGMAGGGHKRKRSWSRAVFTSLQRKGLEKRFEIQKYVNKPERRQLASALGLSDAQVKVWFQNRRMKWRHTQQFKRAQEEHKDDDHGDDIPVDAAADRALRSDDDEDSPTTNTITIGNPELVKVHVNGEDDDCGSPVYRGRTDDCDEYAPDCTAVDTATNYQNM